jgi:catechol 2,3-dioxygenase-like lactoylglutathione lyase family enzyme
LRGRRTRGLAGEPMALHGLASITVGVPDLGSASAFYDEFGLRATSAGRFATVGGGEQLQLVARSTRALVEFACAADDQDDVDRVRRAAAAAGIATADDGGDLLLAEPVVGIGVRVTVRRRIVQVPVTLQTINAPGVRGRGFERAPAIVERDGATPRRLGHALYTTPDIDASKRFLEEVLGFRASDVVPGVIAFMRCSTDHHNIGLISSPVPFFHHSSWQVDDVDAIGHGARKLLAVDPTRNVWGLGRHFLGSNYFWYFRDPAGNYAEYFADLDQIDDAEWTTGSWTPDKALYSWGPPVPPTFVEPADVEEIAVAAGAAASDGRS